MYVNVAPINIVHDCNVVIRMQNLVLMKVCAPKPLQFIYTFAVLHKRIIVGTLASTT